MAALTWCSHDMVPPVKYKGGKRSYAADIARHLGVWRPAEALLVEASWHVACALRVAWDPELRAMAAARYEAWAEPEEAQRERWSAMLGDWPADPVEAGIQWLWMRPRTVPMREPHVTRARGDWLRRVDSRGGSSYTLDAPGPALSRPLPDMRVTVLHADVRDVEPVPGAVLYLDPPYLGTTGYAADLPRDGVIATAARWRDAGCVVGVSETEPMPGAAEVHDLRHRGARARAGIAALTPERLTVLRP